MKTMSQPWHKYQPSEIATAPAMLGGEEIQFLYWLARDQYTGVGEIVDLGAFLGASAAAFGHGLSDNTLAIDKFRRIHSFDFFKFEPFYRAYIPDFEGDDTLPVFLRNTERFAGYITPVKGNICEQAWAEPIEILFVDFTQTWQHHDAIARVFYPHLTQGGILVHQDYLYTVSYWLHIFMEFYSDYFELISPHIRESSAAWRLRRPLPDAAFHEPLYRRLSVGKMLALLDRSIAKYVTISGEPYVTLLKIARCRFILHAYGAGRAKRYAATIGNNHQALASFRREIDLWHPDSSPYRNIFRLGWGDRMRSLL